MTDINREHSPSQIDALIQMPDFFPFVDRWSTRTAHQMFNALVASPYNNPETIPTVPCSFERQDFKFMIPDRMRKAIPELEGRVILTHNIDLQDYRTMNAVGEFFMEDLRLTSSKRYFMKSTPMEMWDNQRDEVLALARRNAGPNASLYDLRNALVRFAKESNPFRPSLALGVYSLFGATRILDMSGGWGDRLLGALAWERASHKVELYESYDPFLDLHPRYATMIKAFGGTSCDKFETIPKPFEEAKLTDGLKTEHFDLAFTSPPYFDFEEYGLSGDDRSSQSTEKYPRVEDWMEEFLKPMMRKAAEALSPGGRLAMNIEGPWVTDLLKSNPLPKEMKYQGILGYKSDEPHDRTVHPTFVWRRA